MRILVTGSAGFIGSHLCIKLLKLRHSVYGVDNHNDYYSKELKEDRLNNFLKNKKYKHFRIDISDSKKLFHIFQQVKPHIVVNLAAQAGVRYSILNPMPYVQSNLVGFSNILECCRKFKTHHLIYASSSGVYGANIEKPFKESHRTDHPLSFYAATKKSNEVMAYSYSHLYKLPTTALRFFTVYGPWDRPDMALQSFAKSIMEEKEVNLFNKGMHKRDFTYIDDIINSITKIIEKPQAAYDDFHKIYNLGNSSPTNLVDYLSALEKSLGKKAKIKFDKMQPGDVLDTHACNDSFYETFDYRPKTSILVGVEKFSKWFLDYYKYTS